MKKFSFILILSLAFFSQISPLFAANGLKFCTNSSLTNLKKELINAYCENATKSSGDKINIDVAGYKNKEACKNTYKAISETYVNFEKMRAEACKTEAPSDSAEKLLNCENVKSCISKEAEILQPHIDSLTNIQNELNAKKELLEKLSEKNLIATDENIKKNAYPTSPVREGKKDLLLKARKEVAKGNTDKALSHTNNLANREPKDLEVIEEIEAARKAKKLTSGISSALGLIANDLSALQGRQNKINKFLGGSDQTDDTPPPADESGGFFSSLDPAKMMQMAAAGMGLYQALNPQTDSGISDKNSPTPTPVDPVKKVDLGSSSNKSTNKDSAPDSTDPKKSDAFSLGENDKPYTTSGGYTPVSDISKDPTSPNEKNGGTSPSTGGSSGSLGSGASPERKEASVAEKSKVDQEEEALGGLAGGGLKYQGSSSSSEPSEFDSSVKDILKEMETAGKDESPFDGAFNGETNDSTQGSGAEFSGTDGIDGADGASLFARMRAFHDRCLKKGCVLNGLGEKI